MIDACARAVERIGFRPRLAPNSRQRLGFLAGADEARAADVMGLFADPEVRAIVCVRGGYGSARIAPLLDYEFIAQHPKILTGYSDVTALVCALRRRAGLVAFHGPMLAADFARRRTSKFTLRSFLRTLTQAKAPGSILEGYSGPPVKILRTGLASGPLVGGNLSVLCATLGTPYEPSFEGGILFLEDVGEAPYRIDRMLTQLAHAGRLQHVAGIAIGVNTDCVDTRANLGREYRQSVEDVILERLSPLQIPVVAGLPFGHIRNHATLPVGVKATLDAVHGDLTITEAAVT